MPLIELLDLAGVAVFAVSGALLAASRRQTLVTFIFFAVVTGVGGGTARDLLIDVPVFWIQNNAYLGVCVAAAVLVWALPARLWTERALVWFDALSAALTVLLMLLGVPAFIAGVVAALAGFTLRGAAIGRGWALPAYER